MPGAVLHEAFVFNSILSPSHEVARSIQASGETWERLSLAVCVALTRLGKA